MFQLIEMLIGVCNFFELSLSKKSDPKIVSCEPALKELMKISKVAWSWQAFLNNPSEISLFS